MKENELVQGANEMLNLAAFVQSWNEESKQLDQKIEDARRAWQQWRESTAWKILALPGPEQEKVLAALPEPVRHPIKLRMNCVERFNQETAIKMLSLSAETRREALDNLSPVEKTIAERALAVEAGLQTLKENSNE